MNITIRKNLRLHGGTYVWEVQELKTDNSKPGGLNWVTTSWLGRDLGKALRWVGEEEILAATDLPDACARLARLDEMASAILTGLIELGASAPGVQEIIDERGSQKPQQATSTTRSKT